MRISPSTLAPAFLALTLSLGARAPAAAQSSGKPLLSEEIGRVLESDGHEAAELRFNEIYPSQTERYEVDFTGMAMLGSAQMQKNDMEAFQAVMRMVTVLQESEMAKHMPATAAQGEQREEARREEEKSAEEARAEASRADARPKRDDLDRFIGEYGDPSQQDRQPVPRNLYVFQTCDGYLAAAPIWADTSPWFLTPAGDTSFEHSNYVSFTMVFEVDHQGKAVALTQEGADLGTEGSRLELIKPLDDPACVRFGG